MTTDRFSREIGFLGWVPSIPEELQRDYGPLFRLCEDLNRCSHHMLLGTPLQATEPSQALGVLAFVRCLESLQSAYILVRAGLSQDAAVCLRSAFEALCLLRCSQVRPDLALGFVAADDLEQLKLANANIARLRRGQTSHPDLLATLEKGREQLKVRIAQEGTKRISAFDLAEAGDLLSVYETMWRMVSKYAHISPRALEEYIAKEGDADLVYGRDYREISTHLTTIAEFSLLAQADLGRLMRMEASDAHQRCALAFRSLVDQLNQQSGSVGERHPETSESM